MPEYSSQSDLLRPVQQSADRRRKELKKELKAAFSGHIRRRTVEVILLHEMSVSRLAEALRTHPLTVKPLMSICNIAARAVERDLGMKNLDTFNPRLSETEAAALAGYLKSFLPPCVEIPSLLLIDRVNYFDKEVRKNKGRWEKMILQSLVRQGRKKFKKRKFEHGGEQYEIDAASPPAGAIETAVDIKRIEARRDIHKRCDEIINKPSKLKRLYPRATFAAVIYYPFVTEQNNIQARLRSKDIDFVFFASDAEESVDSACRLLLASVGGR